MNSLINILVTIFLLFFILPIQAQISGYVIESFQDEYSELSSYQSIALLTKGDPLWNYEFQLDFPFPFFDSTYNRIIYNHSSWGSLTDDQDESLLLMDSGGGFTYENVVDTNNITSDVRFSNVDYGNIKAFVVQFTKARFFADPFADSLDTYLNFQLWFFENGIMEVHFGEIHLDNSPIDSPGKGFYCYTTSGGVDTNEICGPRMGISDPLDEENAVGLQGSYDNYEVIPDNYATLTNLPPQGWIIRFKPIWVATSDPNPLFKRFNIIPNPSSSFIELPFNNVDVLVFNEIGTLISKKFWETNLFDISNLSPGIYSVSIMSENMTYISRFVKQ